MAVVGNIFSSTANFTEVQFISAAQTKHFKILTVFIGVFYRQGFRVSQKTFKRRPPQKPIPPLCPRKKSVVEQQFAPAVWTVVRYDAMEGLPNQH